MAARPTHVAQAARSSQALVRARQDGETIVSGSEGLRIGTALVFRRSNPSRPGSRLKRQPLKAYRNSTAIRFRSTSSLTYPKLTHRGGDPRQERRTAQEKESPALGWVSNPSCTENCYTLTSAAPPSAHGGSLVTLGGMAQTSPFRRARYLGEGLTPKPQGCGNVPAPSLTTSPSDPLLSGIRLAARVPGQSEVEV